MAGIALMGAEDLGGTKLGSIIEGKSANSLENKKKSYTPYIIIIVICSILLILGIIFLFLGDITKYHTFHKVSHKKKGDTRSKLTWRQSGLSFIIIFSIILIITTILLFMKKKADNALQNVKNNGYNYIKNSFNEEKSNDKMFNPGVAPPGYAAQPGYGAPPGYGTPPNEAHSVFDRMVKDKNNEQATTIVNNYYDGPGSGGGSGSVNNTGKSALEKGLNIAENNPATKEAVKEVKRGFDKFAPGKKKRNKIIAIAVIVIFAITLLIIGIVVLVHHSKNNKSSHHPSSKPCSHHPSSKPISKHPSSKPSSHKDNDDSKHHCSNNSNKTKHKSGKN